MHQVNWKVLAGATVACLIGIVVSEPAYVSLQTAPGAAEFIDRSDHDGRAILAGVFDIGFAIGYGVLGLWGLRAFGQGRAPALISMILVAVGSLADVVENLVLIRNVSVGDDLTNAGVEFMQIFGGVKWVAVLGAIYLIVVIAIHRGRPPSAPGDGI